jgi:hypothetical protein
MATATTGPAIAQSVIRASQHKLECRQVSPHAKQHKLKRTVHIFCIKARCKTICQTRAIMSRAVNRKYFAQVNFLKLEKCRKLKKRSLRQFQHPGRDALHPSTGILDRADLQLRSLQYIAHSTLSCRSPLPTVRSATTGSRDPLP